MLISPNSVYSREPVPEVKDLVVTLEKRTISYRSVGKLNKRPIDQALSFQWAPPPPYPLPLAEILNKSPQALIRVKIKAMFHTGWLLRRGGNHAGLFTVS